MQSKYGADKSCPRQCCEQYPRPVLRAVSQKLELLPAKIWKHSLRTLPPRVNFGHDPAFRKLTLARNEIELFQRLGRPGGHWSFISRNGRTCSS